MPFNKYLCLDCGQEFSLVMPADAGFELPECPACGSANTEDWFAAEEEPSEDCESCSGFR